jgi:chromosome segregation ATPase
LVTILLTLAVLGGINGSLKFATSAQVQTMQREASQLSAQTDTLQQDLDGLRGRVDMLEGLGDRTVALEIAQQQLAADQETASQQVTALQTEIAALNEKVTLQEERTQRFETFLIDLQTMLDNLFTPQGGNQ